MDFKNVRETLIVFSVFTGMLLPVRLLFVSYVSDDWLGSFGIISVISILVLILTKKGKLGTFGQMFERQLRRIQSGKKGKLLYGQAIFFLLILGGTIFSIEQGNSEYLALKDEILTENEEFKNPEQIIEKTQELEAKDWLLGFIALFVAVFVAFPQICAVFAVLNDSFDGWILHFYTVAFVEYLELFGILLLYKLSLQKNLKLDFFKRKIVKEKDSFLR